MKSGAVGEELEVARGIAEDLRARGLFGDAAPGYYIRTFGCQQNEADSEQLAGIAEAMGFVPAPGPEGAKLILVNTCAIREHAEKKALSVIGTYKHVKDADPGVIIGVGGCMAAEAHRAETLKRSYPYVDFVFEPSSAFSLPSLVRDAMGGTRRFLSAGANGIAEGLPKVREKAYSAWLSVMYGCNNFCSYCIVPYVRGRERSRRPEDVVEEAKRLVDGGAKNITLLGQNVNSYGKDGDFGCGIAELMRRICRIDGDFELRFMTSHPKDASDELIDVIAEEKKVVKHFHLPVQSGSDRILAMMNRHYDRERYLSVVEKLRARVPDVTLTSDIIVGFPGEEEKDFLDTLDLMRLARFDMIFSFIYSPRVGTPAAKMEPQIPRDVSAERMERLLALGTALSEERNSRFVGRTLRVLADGVSRTDPGMMTGRGAPARPVHFPGGEELTGKFVNVDITGSGAFWIAGELSEKE
ncbi:MAG: tRNA (N6-isopentenyl adenosine(37)-C2)-methylthiotransferase MiaB [Clostridia bacterium]|nr:tRNA (N6-isopentenyl adenosine(37)-C2)-methylthiotransferase MiaB [Clostridia bacterium]